MGVVPFLLQIKFNTLMNCDPQAPDINLSGWEETGWVLMVSMTKIMVERKVIDMKLFIL